MIVDLINLDFKDRSYKRNDINFEIGKKENISKFEIYRSKIPSGYNHDLNRNSQYSNIYLPKGK